MPGGQNDHLLSPYYGSSHADWVADKATALLPRLPERTLCYHSNQSMTLFIVLNIKLKGEPNEKDLCACIVPGHDNSHG